MGSQQFCLKWNNHQSNMLTVFDQLLADESFVDVTIACDGFTLKAHKMVLSACSPYFQKIFVDNPCQHPIVILKDITYEEMKAIIDFMYKGEVNVSQDQLSALLKTAETLKVKGLAEVTSEQVPEKQLPHTESIPVKRPAVGSVRSFASSRRKRKPSGTTIRSMVQQPLAASAIAGVVASNSSSVQDESHQDDNKNDNETMQETPSAHEFVTATVGNIKNETVDEQIETSDAADVEEPETEQMEYSLQEYATASMTTQSTTIANPNDARVSSINSQTSGGTIGGSSTSVGRPSTSAGSDDLEHECSVVSHKRQRTLADDDNQHHNHVDLDFNNIRHLSASRAAAHLGLSRSMARKLVQEGFLSRRRGPRPILSDEEEMSVVDYICSYHVRGIGVQPKRTDIINYACGLLQSRDLSEEPHVKTVGKKWWATFRRRHPELDDFLN